jgi:hypothetical protein
MGGVNKVMFELLMMVWDHHQHLLLLLIRQP